MNMRQTRNKWTEENIYYLKTAYLEGASLKEIAGQLQRSVSAVNKALERHHLRTHNRMERLPALPRPTVQQIQQKKRLEAQKRQESLRKVKFHWAHLRKCVSFEHVLLWLRTQKIFVTKSTSDVYYEMNGIPNTQHQILLKANVLREQHHLPIFQVKGVTNA
ncbi:MAG: hypothetical protein K0R76_1062 [Alphaproteobacteria bacterium]|jgi:IS30 family transposase|nr:hypothetical protein [Alphaproteobacteria bacterium]MDF3034108.1 hypothetical protein [Alphaproteobacteria bacterium]